MASRIVESIVAAVVVVALFVMTPLHGFLSLLTAALLYDHFMRTSTLYKVKELIGMNKKRTEENMSHYRNRSL